MSDTKYLKIDRSISTHWANMIGIGLLLPIFTIPSAIFIWIWDAERIWTGISDLVRKPFVYLMGLFVLIVLHELIHGFTWQLLGRVNREEIEYGFKWKTLSPYAHLKVPIKLQPYRWGAVMPGILLGLLPVISGLLLGCNRLFLVGLIMSAAAGGDMMILFLLRQDDKSSLVEDHPSKAGCFVLLKNNNQVRLPE